MKEHVLEHQWLKEDPQRDSHRLWKGVWNGVWSKALERGSGTGVWIMVWNQRGSFHCSGLKGFDSLPYIIYQCYLIHSTYRQTNLGLMQFYS